MQPRRPYDGRGRDKDCSSPPRAGPDVRLARMRLLSQIERDRFLRPSRADGTRPGSPSLPDQACGAEDIVPLAPRRGSRS
jgi:hypothetical protein